MMMPNSEYEALKDVPGYRAILKTVLKRQIQYLVRRRSELQVEQLACETEEETVILSACTSDGTLGHLGSLYGIDFLKDKEDIKFQFLQYCLKQKHFSAPQHSETTDDCLNVSVNIDDSNCYSENDKRSIPQASTTSFQKSASVPEVTPINIFENSAITDEAFEHGKAEYSSYIKNAFTESLASYKEKVTEKSISSVKRKRCLSSVSDSLRLKVSKMVTDENTEARENGFSSVTEPKDGTELDIVDKGKKVKQENEQSDEEYTEMSVTTFLGDRNVVADSLTKDLQLLEQDKALLISLRDSLPQGCTDKHTLIGEAERLHINPADLYKTRFRKALNIPLEDGERPFKCPLCSSCFKLRHHLKNHFSVHSSQGMFKCDLCPKSFTRKATLKSHRRIHIGETYYHCDQCMSAFPEADRLLYHKCPGKNEFNQLTSDVMHQSAVNIS